MVSEKRNYIVINTEQAKGITSKYLRDQLFDMENISFGLPEIYDRYNIWNVPILYKKEVIGEIAVNAYSRDVDKKMSSDISILDGRKKKIDIGKPVSIKKCKKKKEKYIVSDLENMVLKGRAEKVLKQLPEKSIDMIFTSPPYYNARKQYSEFDTYEDYLALIRKVVRECNRVLIDGKFFIINSSHVLVPRASRNESSSRIAVPFDIHQIFMEEGFEFVDDIIWEKPEGAGWASGRGRRFSADRNPMQYKAVPVTEYVMVYRKKPAIIVDHFIRNHPNQNIIQDNRLMEMNFGIFEGQKITDILKENHDLYYQLWHEPEKFTCIPEGESYDQVIERVHSFLKDIQQLPDHSQIMIITHGMYFIVLLATMLGLEKKEFVKLNQKVVDGCSLTCVLYDHGVYTLDFYNECSFLPHIANESFSK